MGLIDERRAAFEAGEIERVRRWDDRRDHGERVAAALDDATPFRKRVGRRFGAPHEVDLALSPTWHQQGIVLIDGEEDEVLLYARVEETDSGDAGTITIHPLGTCRVCERRTPLGAVESEDGFDAEVYAGAPCAGHDCRGV